MDCSRALAPTSIDLALFSLPRLLALPMASGGGTMVGCCGCCMVLKPLAWPAIDGCVYLPPLFGSMLSVADRPTPGGPALAELVEMLLFNPGMLVLEFLG
jgi:hypothetical protein